MKYPPLNKVFVCFKESLILLITYFGLTFQFR